MNCGHDEDPVEMFTRSALAMKTKPTVIYLLSGTPFWKAEDCINITKKTQKPNLTKKEKALLSLYHKDKKGLKAVTNNSTVMQSFTFLYKTSTSHDGIPSLYSEVAPMAQVSKYCLLFILLLMLYVINIYILYL